MFQALLYGKLEDDSLSALEDVLTSDVFGAFHYLPPSYIGTSKPSQERLYSTR